MKGVIMKAFKYQVVFTSVVVLFIATISITFAQGNISYESIVRQYIVEFWNRQNINIASEVLASEATLTSPDGVMEGTNSIKAFQNTYTHAFSDLNFLINDVTSKDNEIKIDWTLRGTHDGEFAGIAPTWQKVELKGTSTYLLANSKIIQEVMLFNKLDLLRQLGVSLEASKTDAVTPTPNRTGKSRYSR